MRSFIIFTLFALTLCKSPLDIITGFTTQLVLSDEQTLDADNCVGGIVYELNNLVPLYSDYLAGDVDSLIEGVASFFEGLEPAVQASCDPFVNDLVNYALTFGNGQTLQQNTEANGPYVAQHLAVLVQYIATGNFTGIGSAVGYLFQLAVGAVDLPPLGPQQLTSEQIQALEESAQTLQTDDEALTQYIQGYVQELNVAEKVNVDSLVQLVDDLRNLTLAGVTLQHKLNTGDFDSDITAIEDFVTDALETVRRNQLGLQSAIAIDAPVYRNIVNYPGQAIAQIIFNAFLNCPQVLQLQSQFVQDMIDGDYAAVGADEANVVKAYIGQLYAA